MARAFAEPSTCWRGAFRRAAAWSGPQLLGALAVEQIAPRPWREGLSLGLMLGVVPVGLMLWYRSWRVGVAVATAAILLVAAALAMVSAWARLLGWGG